MDVIMFINYYEFIFLLCETDGLMDCMDPDCCIHTSCQEQIYCLGAPDPKTMTPQRPLTPTMTFYERVSFLIAAGGTQRLPAENPFNSRSESDRFPASRCLNSLAFTG